MLFFHTAVFGKQLYKAATVCLLTWSKVSFNHEFTAVYIKEWQLGGDLNSIVAE